MNNCVLISDSQTGSIYCYNNTYDIDNNWWGQNNPNFSVLTNNILPNNWRLMTLSAIDMNSSYDIKVSLNKLTDDTIIDSDLLNRNVHFSTDNGILGFESMNISSSVINSFIGNLNDLTVRIDDEELGVYDKTRPYLDILNTAAYINDTVSLVVV